MELRYLGFDQLQNARAFRFEVVVKGATTMQAVVVADMALFLEYRVGIQDGPSLCAARLTADLEQNVEGNHVLTADDLRGLCERRAAAEGKRTEIRRMAGRRAQRARSQATLAEGCKRTENGPFRASTVVIRLSQSPLSKTLRRSQAFTHFRMPRSGSWSGLPAMCGPL